MDLSVLVDFPVNHLVAMALSGGVGLKMCYK